MILGEAGEDTLCGEAGSDILLGGAGRDELYGDRDGATLETLGSDYLDGGDGVDRLFGLAGDDILIGGKDNDILVGGPGRDTYIFNKGDGIDEIHDDDTGEEKSLLIFGEGVDKDAIKLRKGSLLLDLGDGDAIHIENFDQTNPLATQSFASFQFADGSSLSWEELLARGFDLDGTDLDDEIAGTGVADRIDGKAGNDLIWGLDGNDTISGGTGIDGTSGGLGDDSYIVRTGDAQADLLNIETLLDEGGDDTLRLEGIDPASLVVGAGGTPGALRLAFATNDELQIENALSNAIEHYALDNETLTPAELIGRHAETVLTASDAAGHAILHGGQRNDTLTALAGHSILSGGRGNDILSAGGGNNSYRYSLGDGTDRLTDTGAKTDALGVAQRNTLRFGAGIGVDDLRLDVGASGALILQVGADANDAIHIQGFDPASATGAIDLLEFSDGTTLAYAELIARGTDVIGTDGDDLLTGTVLHDRLIGGTGNDRYRITEARDEIIEAENAGEDTVESVVDYTLGTNLENLLLTGAAITGSGNALDNLLAGNARDNILAGGEGIDSYRLARQSGSDLVIDSGANRIVLEAGLGFDDIAATREGDDLRLAIRRDSGALRLPGYFTDGVAWQISDAYGVLSDTDTLLAETAAYEEDGITTLARDFLADTRLAIEQNLPVQGYALQADGTWRRATQFAMDSTRRKPIR